MLLSARRGRRRARAQLVALAALVLVGGAGHAGAPRCSAELLVDLRELAGSSAAASLQLQVTTTAHYSCLGYIVPARLEGSRPAGTLRVRLGEARLAAAQRLLRERYARSTSCLLLTVRALGGDSFTNRDRHGASCVPIGDAHGRVEAAAATRGSLRHPCNSAPTVVALEPSS